MRLDLLFLQKKINKDSYQQIFPTTRASLQCIFKFSSGFDRNCSADLMNDEQVLDDTFAQRLPVVLCMLHWFLREYRYDVVHGRSNWLLDRYG